MVKFYLFVLTMFFGVFAVQNAALAERPNGFWRYVLTPDESDYSRVYLNGGKSAYNSDWEYPNWTPALWAGDAAEAQAVIDNFYETGVLTHQKLEENIPVMVVGQRFLDLSGRDQRRVVKFVAYAFGIEGMTGNGAMKIVLGEECRFEFMCDDVALGEYRSGAVMLH